MAKERKEAGIDKIVQEAKDNFATAIEAESDNRDYAVDDLEFRNGEQWPDTVRRDRERDGRPCLTLDRTDQYVRQIINNIRESRPAIKVRPVDDEADPETAEIINGMIRAIEQSCNAEIAYDWAAEYAVSMGWGYFRINTDYTSEDSFDQDIRIERVYNPFTVYIDPNAEEPDGSDAKWAFEVDWMEKKQFESRFPKAHSEWPLGEQRGIEKETWFEKNKVRVARYWKVDEEEFTLNMLQDGSTVEGNLKGQMIQMEDGTEIDAGELVVKSRKSTRQKVKWYLLTGAEVLDKGDWAGKYIPIVPVLGEELNVEGERFLKGLVRRMKDAQRQYNYWRSAHTEKVALAPQAPWVGPEGAFKNQKWKLANKKNYAYLEYDPEPVREYGVPPPHRETGAHVSQGDVYEMQVAADDLNAISGIHPPGLGEQSNEVSGRAVFQRQSASDKSNYHYLDNLARAMRHCGRILVDLIPKIYDTERMINILKPDGEEEKVYVNTEQPYFDQDGQQKQYRLDTGKYDVQVDIGPSYTTQRQEAQSFMLEMLRSVPDAGHLIADLLAKNSDAAGSDEIAERLKSLVPPEVLAKENPQVANAIRKAQGQIQQYQQQLSMMQEELKKRDLQLQDKSQEHERKVAELRQKAVQSVRELQEKARQADQKFFTDAAKLEFEFAKDIEGVGVDSSNVQPLGGSNA